MGWLFKILGYVLSLCFPVAGPVIIFICKLLPAIITFIWTQVMLLWNKNKQEKEEEYKSMLAGQSLSGKKAVAKLKDEVIKSSSKIRVFKGQR